jgi:hypothetical protein
VSWCDQHGPQGGVGEGAPEGGKGRCRATRSGRGASDDGRPSLACGERGATVMGFSGDLVGVFGKECEGEGGLCSDERKDGVGWDDDGDDELMGIWASVASPSHSAYQSFPLTPGPPLFSVPMVPNL